MYVGEHEVPADVEAVRLLLASQRTPPERQKAIWIDLWRQWPHPTWGELCLKEAEAVDNLLRRAEALAPATLPRRKASIPPLPPVRRHFTWLGERHGVSLDTLRACIRGLSDAGLIASESSQQDALRRGLGLMTNGDECISEAPWVTWLGAVDMLTHLIDGLWEMDLITCVGGNSQKWRTACGIFLRSDGTHFGSTLRNSRCSNTNKIKILERAFFAELRFVTSFQHGIRPPAIA